jgi:hypothetical protein
VSYGWLGRDLNQPPCVEGITFDPYMPTRREEYALVARTLKAIGGAGDRMVLDAATGFTPHQHVLPYIIANCGWTCLAIDSNPETLKMPWHPMVYRLEMDITRIDLMGPFQAVTCISVLEHCPPEVQLTFAAAASQLVPVGGTLIITADEADPEIIPNVFPEFDFGKRVDDPAIQLNPRVGFGVGIRR